jgi:hypothetical protein
MYCAIEAAINLQNQFPKIGKVRRLRYTSASDEKYLPT